MSSSTPRPLAIALAGALALAGCAEPQCPSGYLKVENACRRIPEAGTEIEPATAGGGDGAVLESAGADASGGADGAVSSLEGGAPSVVAMSPNADAAMAMGIVDAASGQPEPASCAAVTPEVCDGKDNDCDGMVDEQVKTRCWADADGDGFAAQNATVTEGCDQCGAKQTSVAPAAGKVDCDDTDGKRSPGATDICGDAIDNDCDGMPDDEANNACGGPCTSPLAGRPGGSCTNKLQGACARTGIYECLPDHSLRCTAMSVAGTTEVCGDGSDNDCDGAVDNGCVRNACGGWSRLANAKGATCSVGAGACASTGSYQCQGSDATVCNAAVRPSRTWYPDCDSDGFAASSSGQMEACAKPAVAAGCDWTSTAPVGASVDCDPMNARRHPGADYGISGGGSPDLDCNGTVSQRQEFVASSDPRFHAALSYPLCTKRLEELTRSDCNCWFVSTMALGFNRFGPNGPEARQIAFWLGGASGHDAAPCAEAADTVGIALQVYWHEETGGCSGSDYAVALRTVCR